MVYQSLLNIMLDEDYGDITDPVSGRDVKVVCTRQPGRKWATTEVRPRGKESKLTETPEKVSELVSSIPNLENMHELKSYDELSKIINDWLSGDDDSSEGKELPAATPGAAQEGSSDADGTENKGYRSLDDAFADLMD